MKTSYSRRELYAFGEPIGDSSTYETAGRRVYGGGGGGILGGISDALSGIDDAIISPVVNEVSKAGSSVDDFVNEEIPGGWALPIIAVAAANGVPIDPSAAGAGGGAASDRSDERCEDVEIMIKIQAAIGFAIVLLRSAAHSTDVLSSFSAYPHISRPIRLVLSPVAELLQTRYSATHASQTRLFL
jgi:hypothetical protein